MATPPDPKQTEMARQISQAWDLARTQLAKLREQVEKTAQLAQTKTRTDAIEKERDRALRNFGEAVWREVKAGSLRLPQTLNGAVRAVQEADRKHEKQAAEINDILAEGAEVADRLAKKKGPGGR